MNHQLTFFNINNGNNQGVSQDLNRHLQDIAQNFDDKLIIMMLTSLP